MAKEPLRDRFAGEDAMSAVESVLLAQHLVSSRMGLIRDVRERRSPYDGFNVIDVVGKLRSYLSAGECVSETNGGGNFFRLDAQAAAIGECIERYALGIYDASHLALATIRDVNAPASTPEALTFFTDTQYELPGFPIRRFTPDSRLRWVTGCSAISGEVASVPASLVYLPYAYAPEEFSLSYQMSIGTSCHTSLAEAALRAILEVVERDALTICWESRTSFPPINTEQVCELTRTLNTPMLRVLSFDLTNDLEIPVVLTLVTSSLKEPEVAIGIAAHIDGEKALEKSVLEAITSFRSSIHLCRDDRRSRADIKADLIRTPHMNLHALYHARLGALTAFEFLLTSPLSPVTMTRGTGGAAPALLDATVARLRCAKQETVLFDLTPDEVCSHGLFVVRAVMPGLVRQTVGLALRHLRNPRILGVPDQLGYPSECRSLADVLQNQIPFP